VNLTGKDGRKSEIEVYLFGELSADGKVRRVHELTRPISGEA
jgi:hypothetical protein